MNAFRSHWKDFNQKPWAELEAAIGGDVGSERPPWYDRISSGRQAIADALAIPALQDLSNAVVAMDGLLADASAESRRNVDQAVRELLTLSDQTLGRLPEIRGA